MKTEDAFKKLKISYVGNNFKEWFYPLKFDPKNKVKKLISQKLPRAMNDKEILAELKPTEVSMEEIVATLKTLDHSVWALFYCRDNNSLLRAVRVSWSDDGWCVFAGGVAYTEVSGAPAANQYSVTGGVYTFNAANAGQQVVITYLWALSEGTDYTITLPNRVVLASAPGSLLTYFTGQFFFVCRFNDDQQDYEKFYDRLWDLQECKFRSILQ